MTGNLSFDWGDGINLKNENNGSNYYANLRVHYAPDVSGGTVTYYLNPSGVGSSETIATTDSLNLVSITRVVASVTTGGTGNIATSYANDGYTYVIAPIVSGNSCYLRAWISANNNGWYLTAVNPNTGATINNASLNIRYLVVKIKYT